MAEDTPEKRQAVLVAALLVEFAGGRPTVEIVSKALRAVGVRRMPARKLIKAVLAERQEQRAA